MISRRPCISLAALIALAGCSMSPPSSVDDLVERARSGVGLVGPAAPEPVPVPAGTPEAPRPQEAEQPKPAPSPPPAPAPAPAAPASATTADPRRHPLRLPIGLGEIEPAPAPARAQAVSPGLDLADTTGLRAGDARSPRLGVGEVVPITISGRSVAIPVDPARPLPSSGVSLAALDPAVGAVPAGPSARRAPINLDSADMDPPPSGRSPGLVVGEASVARADPVTSPLLRPSDAAPRRVASRSERVGLPSPAEVAPQVRQTVASPRIPEPAAGPASPASPPQVKAPYKGRVLSVVATEATLCEVSLDAQVSIRVADSADVRAQPVAKGVALATPGVSPASASTTSGPSPTLGELPAEQAVRRQPEDRQGEASGLSRWLRSHFPFLF